MNRIVLAGLVGLGLGRESFEEWADRFGKTYSPRELEQRKANFEATVQRVTKLNKKYDGETTFGLNQFADLTLDEFHSYAACHKPALKADSERSVPKGLRASPDSWDWRANGTVTPVKDQKQCGSCWAFGTIGMVEGTNKIVNGALVSFSEQDLVDCAKKNNKWPNDGCNGGRSDWASEYIQDKGVNTEAAYPYKGKDGSCMQKSPPDVMLANYITLKKGDEGVLKDTVYNLGPAAVSIDVTDSFANYKSGVWQDSSCQSGEQDLDHCVLVVGYGTDSGGKDYWIVKNSWGTTWGNQGYILMRRNYNNMCGIATDAVHGIAKTNSTTVA